jgi:hypothetical protein
MTTDDEIVDAIFDGDDQQSEKETLKMTTDDETVPKIGTC